MLSRRELLERGLGLGAAALLFPFQQARPSSSAIPPAGVVPGTLLRRQRRGEWVNDVHSGLNRTRVHRIERPASVAEVQAVLRRARGEGRAVSIAGARHAMGGQQFGRDTVLLDASKLSAVHAFDARRGIVDVGAGIRWPELIDALAVRQRGCDRPWSIVQKQTGADRLSLGGALAANAHGRGLRYRPIVQDVESFVLVDADGEVHRCSRIENAELFRLAIGGYGLFGVIASVRLRLALRRKVERVVEVVDVVGLADRFERRIAEGYLFGDFQYATDLSSEEGLRVGVFSCYRPVNPETPMPDSGSSLDRRDWLGLIALGHLDRGEAFRRYAAHYRTTSGRIYWSDTHQLSSYIRDYHRMLSERIGALSEGSEMITEIYVPRDALESFLEDARADLRQGGADLIYGTVRLIEPDVETFLAWATEPWACVIFNLHTAHDPESLEKTAGHFRRLIDRGRSYGGSYYLTYHRWATREQVFACYPRFPEFLELKRAYDPEERFTSDWYRHYREIFSA